ncbi:hypothetical protein ACIPWF_22810 [Paenarthrobacter sp. NPDC089989]|uniref:hypothetical protein n=1 Tax=unclassified Paenarthrobacter TaxID=2634190 RepID=UPI00382F6B16
MDESTNGAGLVDVPWNQQAGWREADDLLEAGESLATANLSIRIRPDAAIPVDTFWRRIDLLMLVHPGLRTSRSRDFNEKGLVHNSYHDGVVKYEDCLKISNDRRSQMSSWEVNLYDDLPFRLAFAANRGLVTDIFMVVHHTCADGYSLGLIKQILSTNGPKLGNISTPHEIAIHERKVRRSQFGSRLSAHFTALSEAASANAAPAQGSKFATAEMSFVSPSGPLNGTIFASAAPLWAFDKAKIELGIVGGLYNNFYSNRSFPLLRHSVASLAQPLPIDIRTAEEGLSADQIHKVASRIFEGAILSWYDPEVFPIVDVGISNYYNFMGSPESRGWRHDLNVRIVQDSRVVGPNENLKIFFTPDVSRASLLFNTDYMAPGVAEEVMVRMRWHLNRAAS